MEDEVTALEGSLVELQRHCTALEVSLNAVLALSLSFALPLSLYL